MRGPPLILALAHAATSTALALALPGSDPTALPQCAQTAFLGALPASGCQASDVQCICSNHEFLAAVQSAVQTACTPADQAAVAGFAQNYCGTSGASLAASPSASSSAEPTGSSTIVVVGSSTAGVLTVASLPASVTAPATMTTPSGSLSVDTTALTTSATTISATITHSATTHMSTASASSMPTSAVGGAAGSMVGARLAGLAVVMGLMGAVFAEL
ncbi:hypothetical protein LTR53_001860 [Teratosphaeriaceae sp. CCFEE 6253]|nr:hypothetical protein LTR53_001860 [Teratosphaeriaceae sp. CCFEE 6253]